MRRGEPGDRQLNWAYVNTIYAQCRRYGWKLNAQGQAMGYGVEADENCAHQQCLLLRLPKGEAL
jgi:hypothetical protein